MIIMKCFYVFKYYFGRTVTWSILPDRATSNLNFLIFRVSSILIVKMHFTLRWLRWWRWRMCAGRISEWIRISPKMDANTPRNNGNVRNVTRTYCSPFTSDARARSDLVQSTYIAIHAKWSSFICCRFWFLSLKLIVDFLQSKVPYRKQRRRAFVPPMWKISI